MRAVSRAAETAAPSPNNSLEVRANHGALTGPNPVDRGKLGSRYHLLVDGRGIRLAVGLSAANTYDSALLKPMVERGFIGLRGRPGRPRKRPGPDYMPIRALTI